MTTIDRQVNNTVKAQKSMKDIVKMYFKCCKMHSKQYNVNIYYLFPGHCFYILLNVFCDNACMCQ